jgi:hypothetical protein
VYFRPVYGCTYQFGIIEHLVDIKLPELLWNVGTFQNKTNIVKGKYE